MSIKLITGIMGAGKSFKAVHDIMRDRKKYHKVFNNIQGFKFHDNIEPLILNDFFDMLYIIKDIYTEAGDNDNAVIAYLVEHDILKIGHNGKPIPSLYVIDEAQKKIGKDSNHRQNNEIFIWFATLHRHFFLDVVLITQSFKLINPLVWPLIEIAYHALPSSRVLNIPSIIIFKKVLFDASKLKKFKYQKHMSVPYSWDTTFGNDFIKFNKDIFNIYESGDAVREGSMLTKYFSYILLAIIFILAMGYYFFNYRMNNEEKYGLVEEVQKSTPVDHAPKVITVVKPSYKKIYHSTMISPMIFLN